MYPTISLRWRTLHMTGLGILVFMLTFFGIVRHYCRIYRLSFTQFFHKTPWYIVIIYLMGTYSRYLIEQLVVFPVDRQQLLLYLSPYEYRFHYIGIVIGALLCGIQFLKTVPQYDKARRIDAFFQGTIYGMIPLWVLLLLGDTFIGVPTTWGLYVSAITPNSAVATFDKVIPVGLYLSTAWTVGVWILTLRNKHLTRWFGYRGFAAFFVVLWCIILSQQYPRRLVSDVLGMTRDIRQYVSFGAAFFFFLAWLRYKKSIKA